MGSYPWGPHGEESSPFQVTPNPTPSYVPPPPAPAYAPPPVSYGAPVTYNSAPTSYTGSSAGSAPSGRKRYWLALLLTFFFGPLGLFYASAGGALAMLFLVFAVPLGLNLLGALPVHPANPFAIWSFDSVMAPIWSFATFVSMIWSVIAVRRRNAALPQ